MYHISIKRQIAKLSHDISNITKGERLILEIIRPAISHLINETLETCSLDPYGGNCASDFFCICPGFCFMKCRKIFFLNAAKVSRFFR